MTTGVVDVTLATFGSFTGATSFERSDGDVVTVEGNSWLTVNGGVDGCCCCCCIMESKLKKLLTVVDTGGAYRL